MADGISGHIQAVVARHVREQLDFEFYRIERVDPNTASNAGLPRYVARITLWDSPERIGKLVGERDAADADGRRLFLSRDFKAVVTIEGDKVIDVDWEGIQLS
jgi:hypothetical protein